MSMKGVWWKTPGVWQVASLWLLIVVAVVFENCGSKGDPIPMREAGRSERYFNQIVTRKFTHVDTKIESNGQLIAHTRYETKFGPYDRLALISKGFNIEFMQVGKATVMDGSKTIGLCKTSANEVFGMYLSGDSGYYLYGFRPNATDRIKLTPPVLKVSTQYKAMACSNTHLFVAEDETSKTRLSFRYYNNFLKESPMSVYKVQVPFNNIEGYSEVVGISGQYHVIGSKIIDSGVTKLMVLVGQVGYAYSTQNMFEIPQVSGGDLVLHDIAMKEQFIYTIGRVSGKEFLVRLDTSKSLDDPTRIKLNFRPDESYSGGGVIDPRKLFVDHLGQVYVLGNTHKKIGSTADAYDDNNIGNGDIYVTKWGEHLDPLWTRILGTKEKDNGQSLAVVDKKYLMVTGSLKNASGFYVPLIWELSLQGQLNSYSYRGN